MNGALFFCSKYGSTAQYAHWIAEATKLPVFNVKDTYTDPSKYDFLVVGSPIIYYKVAIHKWVRKHMADLEGKPIVFFTVSGGPAGSKLNGWIANSLPKTFISQMNHVPLRGRQNPKELTLFDRTMLIIGGLKNPDPVARKEELKGFDHMDKSSIEPILRLVHEFQSSRTPPMVSV